MAQSKIDLSKNQITNIIVIISIDLLVHILLLNDLPNIDPATPQEE